MRGQHGYLSLPLMVRPNTVLAVGVNEDRPDYDYADGVEYHVFALDEGTVATTQVPALDGGVEATVKARRDGARIQVSVKGASPTGRRQPWSVLLRGIENVVSVTGGTNQANELGARVVPDAGVKAVGGQVPAAVG